jgi:putative peptidoglycan lipid II flippase
MASPTENTVTSANRQIARAAGTVMIAMLATKLLGFLSTILIAKAFGTTMQSNAYVASNRFTEILFNLVAGGALASAFIPTFTTLLTREDRPGAWKLASAITNWVFLAATLFSLLSYIFAPWIVRTILAPGFTDPAQFALTVQLLRIQLPTVIIFAVSGLVMGMLNGNQRFLFPALAPAMYSLGQIFGLLVLSPSMGVIGLAVGNIIGAVLHLLIQVPILLKLQSRKYSFTLATDMPEVGRTARLMAPRLLGVAAVQLNFLVSTAIASTQPAGSVSALYLAFTIMLMPQIVIAQAAAMAALPTFSAQVARGKPEEMRASLAATLRGVLLLTIPSMLGLVLLRVPLVQLLYQRGDFTAQSTQLVAWALLWYSVGLVAHSVVEVVSRAFYALYDTKTPVIVGVSAMVLNLGLSFLFSWLFKLAGWMPHGGLALALSVSTTLEMIALLAIMRKRLAGLHGSDLWQSVWQGVLGTVIVSAGLMGWLWLTNSRSVWLVVLGGILVGTLLYGIVLLLLRVREVRQVLSFIQKRLDKK